MRIAILTFDGFNEIDSFVALNLLGRVDRPDWRAELACEHPTVTSMNGAVVHAQRSLEEARDADAVVIGSGRQTARVVADRGLLDRLALDPRRQLIGSQCSGALVLHALGLLDGAPVCTDRSTAPRIAAHGVRVLEQPFTARGTVASAGGCLASHYLGTWLIWRLAGRADAERALAYVVPVAEEDAYITRALAAVAPYV